MILRRGRIVLLGCAAACAAVWWNVMYLQHGTRSDLLARTQRLGEAPSRQLARAEQGDGRIGTPKPLPGPPATRETEIDADVVRAVQRELAQRGYLPGVADGLPHPATRGAVMAYEHDHGLPLTAEPSEAILKAILFGVPSSAAMRQQKPPEPQPEARRIIQSVQQSLQVLGYPVASDGRLGEETVRAIRKFETDQGLPASGRISGPLLVRLSEAATRGARRGVAP